MANSENRPEQPPRTEALDDVVIRFVGDSGDGMQLTGTEFTKAAAIAGNDIATLPDFPAEIRAPAGSLAGVSGFQVRFSSTDIFTPGDAPDVLVVMNPAALKTNVQDLVPGGTLIVNAGAFTEGNLKKAGYADNPLDDPHAFEGYRLHAVDISNLTSAALEETDLSVKEKARCKNFFALGLLFWSYSRNLEPEIANIKAKFGRKPRLADANIRVLKAGYHYGETTEVFQGVYEVKPATFEPGVYRNITGNEAVALGLVAASRLAKTKLVYCGYPITPASAILHQLDNFKHFDVTTFEAEDEIAAIGGTIGAAYGGALAVTASSGPGIALKAEGIGLAVMTELPMVIINVQRGGPSTGLPTKTEQSDLFQAVIGRNGDCPLPVLAPKTPGDAFYATLDAARIAIKYMTPVILLSDGYLANGAEPWPLPDVESLEEIPVVHRSDPDGYEVYRRDPDTLARECVLPATPGLEHRIGGLESDALDGNVSYDPTNHEIMTVARRDKIARIARELPDLDLLGDDSGEVLLVGWGGTYGALRQATHKLRAGGHAVSHVHLRFLHPLNPRLEELLPRFEKVLVAELNTGQLRMLLRAEYLVYARGLNKVQGQPFKVSEVMRGVESLLGAATSTARNAG